MSSRTAPCLLLIVALVVALLAPAAAAPRGASVTGGEAPHPEIAPSATGGPGNRIYPVHLGEHDVQLAILVMFSVLMAAFFVFAGFTVATSLPSRRRPPETPPATHDARERRAA